MWAVVGLDLLAAACLCAYVRAGGHVALDPYFLDVARHAGRSLGGLAGYLVGLISYAALLEGVLRAGIQGRSRKLAPSRPRIAGILAATAAYGAICSRYGLLAAACGVVVGWAAAYYYETRRNWVVLAVWHAQWSLLGVAGTIHWALARPGAARTAFTYEYKLSEVREGRLYFDERWGWVDRAHYGTARARLDRLARELRRARGAPLRLTLAGRWTTAYGTGSRFSRGYRVQARSGLPAEQVEAVAAGIALDMARAEEGAQEAAGFFTGSRFSAWQFDDLQSALLACLDRAAPRADGPDGPVAGHEERFRDEGRGLIATEAKRPTLPASATLLQRRTFHEIERSRRFWTALPAQ